MLTPEAHTVELASHVLAERWRLSDAAAVAAVADIAEETGVEVADLATLIVSSISGLAPVPPTARHLMAGDRTDAARAANDMEADWDDLMEGLERRVLRLGVDGLSLGLLNGSRVHTFNRGFSERTSAVYATISAQADLPGPATLRSTQAQYFESHRTVAAHYPKAAGIQAGTRFSAAACLPLVVAGEHAAFGYLAVHYRGTRTFDDRNRAELSRAAAATARAIHRLLGDTRRDLAGVEEDPSLEQMRRKLAGLREAMKTRAEIEQAKGMLMERYALDADQAWILIRRISNESNIKVSAIAGALAQRVAVKGLPPGRSGP